MWGQILAFGIAALTCSLMLQTSSDVDQSVRQNQANAMAGNVLNYAQRVTAFAASNPTYTGTAPDGSLALPTWLNKWPGTTNYINNGVPYTFMPGPQPGMSSSISRISQGKIHVGIKSGATIVLPIGAPTFSLVQPLPAAIPDGAVVIVP